jgi:hypothetical protein
MNSTQLETILTQSLKLMINACEDFPWRQANCYADLMAQTHWYTRRTTRILGLAAVHFKHDCDQLHSRFLQHAAEEKGHEKIALNDIRHLGYDLNDFNESPLTMALY